LFKVLDAKRVRKSGMKDMMTEERILEWIGKYALFKIEL
jgi:hypothetical protein